MYLRESIPRTMVHDNGSQVVEMTILSAQSRPGHAAHSKRRHIERLHREIHLRVHLRAIGIAPPKSFNVKAQHLERASVNNMSIDRCSSYVRMCISLFDQSSLLRSPLFVQTISTDTRMSMNALPCSKIRTISKNRYIRENGRRI